MAGLNYRLSDLLTAGGAAMGNANLRLKVGNLPSLLQTFQLGLTFSGSVRVAPGADELLVLRPRPPRCAAAGTSAAGAGVSITATYIAAPVLIPSPPLGGVIDP